MKITQMAKARHQKLQLSPIKLLTKPTPPRKSSEFRLGLFVEYIEYALLEEQTSQ